jgi:hypothetical protein
VGSGESRERRTPVIRLNAYPIFVVAVIWLKDQNFLKQPTDVNFIDEEGPVFVDLRV